MIQLCGQCNYRYFCAECYDKLRVVAEQKNISVWEAAWRYAVVVE